MNSRTRSTVLVAADLVTIVFARPNFTALRAHLAAPHQWTAAVGVDGALATLAGAAIWALAIWLLVGLFAVALARLPGTAGNLSARIGQVLLPRVVYRLVAGSAGLGVLLAPVAAGASALPGHAARSAPAAALPGHAALSAAAAASLPAHAALSAPAAALPGQAARSTPAAAARVPTPMWPVDPVAAPASDSAPATAARPRPKTDMPPRPNPGASPRLPASAPAASSGRIAVRPGDSLWLIAARRLGPHADATQIAGAWPRWYAANKAVIGADPSLIVPGQILRAPSPAGSAGNSEEVSR